MAVTFVLVLGTLGAAAGPVAASEPSPGDGEIPETLEVEEPDPLAVLSEDPPLGASATTSLSAPVKFGSTYNSFHVKGTHESFSTAAVGDISGDGQPDIVSGGMDGRLRAYHANGSKFLDVSTGGGAIQASPALVDLSGDGLLDVLVANAGGAVAVYKGNGQRIFWRPDNWFFKIQGFIGTPTTADIDADGQLEIIATSLDHHVYAWNLNETTVPGFPRFVYDTIWSSPVAADIDNDGRPEIIFGGDMDYYAGAPYPWGGLLWVLEHNGVPKSGFPKSLPGQVIWSTPAVVDVTGNGNLDIVVGTGLNWPNPWGRKLYAFDRNGNNLPGWPQTIYNGRVMASPGGRRPDGRLETRDRRSGRRRPGQRVQLGWDPEVVAVCRRRPFVSAEQGDSRRAVDRRRRQRRPAGGRDPGRALDEDLRRRHGQRGDSGLLAACVGARVGSDDHRDQRRDPHRPDGHE
ncbi:MAG: VCBS repeat-containing protein [Acidimicrobiia bacterium]|nr:VCBS repeat-containing protein [Acidimicrobiia bacterium]